jgi:hypothetical protein
MLSPLLAMLAPALLAQAAPAAPAAPAPAPPITDLAQLPVTEATAPRCAIAFAIVGRWQQAGEPRGRQWPDMATGGAREFFVQAMAGLMEGRALDREALKGVIGREGQRLAAAGDGAVAAMMPACLEVKRAAGL